MKDLHPMEFAMGFVTASMMATKMVSMTVEMKVAKMAIEVQRKLKT